MNVESKIFQIVLSLLPVQTELDLNARLKDDLGIDSFKIVEIIIAIEDSFDFRFPPSLLEASKINTVGDLTIIAKQMLEA